MFLFRGPPRHPQPPPSVGFCTATQNQKVFCDGRALTQKSLLLENVLIDERKERRARSVVVVVVADGHAVPGFALQRTTTVHKLQCPSVTSLDFHRTHIHSKPGIEIISACLSVRHFAIQPT